MLERLAIPRLESSPAEDETPAATDMGFLQAAVMTGHRRAVELLMGRFADSALQVIPYSTTVVRRHLGAAATLPGRPEEARTHYQDALQVATEMRFRPEVALTRLQLTELLLEHYPEEKSEALEHLDFAINEFCEMKMQPSLERALKHKEILGV